MNFIPPQDETRLRAAASGVLPNGRPVVVNADGTVSVAAAVAAASGTAVNFTSNNAEETDIAYIGSSKIVIAYKDDSASNVGTAVVGTISGTSLSFGTPVVFNNADTRNHVKLDSIGSNKVVIVFQDLGNSYNGAAIVGTVSGTAISFGSEANFETDNDTIWPNVASIGDNKVVIAWCKDAGSSANGIAVVGTVSGTSISFGTEVVFDAVGKYNAVASIGDSKVVIAYRDDADSDKGKAIVGTVSGTNISFGTAVVYNDAGTANVDVGSIGSSKVVIAYSDTGNSNYGTAIVGTVSGTSISYGSEVVFESVSITRPTVSSIGSDRVQITYRDSATEGGQATTITGTVSGTAIAFSDLTTFGNNKDHVAAAAVGDNQIVVAYKQAGNSDALFRQVASTNLTAENYIGMSGGAVSFTGSAASTGSATTFELGKTDTTDIAYIGSNKVVIAYRQHYNTSGSQVSDGYCIVGTISGTSISFGTATAFSTGSVNYVHVANVENNKVVVFFQEGDNSNYATARVGTVSGTGISFGTAVVANSGNSAFTNVAGIGNDKVVGVYRDDGNSDYGTAIVGTVSGTDISFGSEVVFNSGNTPDPVPVSIGSSKVVIAYRDTSNSNYGKTIVGTVSGTSISFGSAVVFEAATIGFGDTGIAYIGSDKVVISYQDEGNSDNGTAIVGTVSGTSISFGTAAVFEAATTTITNSTSIGGDKVVIVYSQGSDAGQGNGKYAVGTVSGTGISFDDAVTFNAAPSWNMAVVSPEDNKVAISWGQHYDTSGSRLGQALVTTIDSRVTVRGQVASGSSASVDIIGTVSENQTGLTAGQSYFVQTDGTIGLTAGSPSVFAGTAISATKLLVKT